MALISTGFSPNVESQDIKLCLKLLFSSKKWQEGSAEKLLEEKIKNYLGVKSAFAFESGRSSLLAVLKLLNLKSSDEVLLQAYTCVAVPDAILWAGAKPVYVDIDQKTFNMSAPDLKKRITSNCKAIIVQHTFGLPAELKEIIKIAKDHNLFVIEDCAHALGAKYKGKLVGKFGDAAIFSFGRDKVISSVYGGAVVTSNIALAKKLEAFKKDLESPPKGWIIKQLLHPILTGVIKSTYNTLYIGKIFMKLAQILGIFSKAVTKEEKSGGKPYFVPSKMPNALAILALEQFSRLREFNNHRVQIANYYYEQLKSLPLTLPINSKNSIYLRFTVKTKNSKGLMNFFSTKNIFPGDWYKEPISPSGVEYNKIGYKKGSCPKAEEAASLSVNLPTNPNLNLTDAGEITNLLKKFYEFSR